MKKDSSTEKKSAWKKSLLFFFFPPKCALCKERGYANLCPVCKTHLNGIFSPETFLCSGGNGYADQMIRLFPYEAPAVKSLVFQWKTQELDDLREIFGSYIEAWAKGSDLPNRIHRITYSPRRNSAKRSAGFDQAYALAKEASHRLGIPFEPLLERRGFSLPQHKTKGEQRRNNVKGVFVCKQKLSGESILLIDDIVTTGATAGEGARILKQSGAMKVFVLCLAH